MNDERKYALVILAAIALPEKYGYIPKFMFKNRILKKAIREVRKTGDTSLVVFVKRARDGKGDIIYLAVYDGIPRCKSTPGVILCRGLMEIPFKNIPERNAAIRTADAIYHYHRSFKQYDCSAGK